MKFIRRHDGLTYQFVRDGDSHGFQSYRRIDTDIFCRRLPGYGWVVCDAADSEIWSRPFDDAGFGDQPPEGVWVSRKGDKSYVYDCVAG